MENLTPTGTLAIVLIVANAIILVFNAVEKIAKAIQIARAPNAKQDERLASLEKWRDEVDRKLDKDAEKLAAIAEDNRITQRALLALLDHGIDGNNKEQMQHSKEELQIHLTNR